nr:DUF2141 domain-containing protein [uncultured Sphingomonas sp.]
MIAASPQPTAELIVSVDGLRNTKGNVLICLTRNRGSEFLKCDKDPAKVARIVPTRLARAAEFAGLTPGEYSLLLIHDENANGRLDTMLGIPKEGFAFSRNPAIRMGPPRYADVHFTVPTGRSAQALRVKYLL